MKRHHHLARLELRPREGVRQGILRLTMAFAEAVEKLAGPEIDPVLAVHETRLALKRMRALWRFARPAVGKPLARRQAHRLRQAAAQLAPARDATVGLRTLDTLVSQGPATAVTSLQPVRDRFVRALTVRSPNPAALRRALLGAARTARTSAAALTRTRWRVRGWKVLEASLRDGYRRVRRRLRAAHAQADETRYHACRTAAKSLLYQLCLIRPAAPKRLDRLIRELDQFQDHLGLENDLAVLASSLGKTPRRFGTAAEVQAVLELIRNRRQRLRKLAIKQAHRCLRERTTEFTKTIERAWKRWHRR